MSRRFGIRCQLHIHRYSNPAYMMYEDGIDSVPKRRHIKFIRQKIAQKKDKYIYDTVCDSNGENDHGKPRSVRVGRVYPVGFLHTA